MKNTQESIAKLKMTLSVDSYPVLKNIEYFRDLNSLLEDNFKQRLSELKKEYDRSGVYEGKYRIITLQDMIIQSEQSTYQSFQQLIRPSLLITLCSFVENVFTYRIESDEILSNKFNKLKARLKNKKYKNEYMDLDKSTIGLAIHILKDDEYNQLEKLDGLDFVKEMNMIRNRFVHYSGKLFPKARVTREIEKLVSKYDFVIENYQIVLGGKFIENYITHLEEFAVEVAKIIYEDESWINKWTKEHLARSNLNISLEGNELINAFMKVGMVQKNDQD